MFLKDNELIIRDATAADAKILCGWWNDGAVMAHAGFPNGLGTTAERIRADLLNNDFHRRRLIIEKNGTPIGEMSGSIDKSGKTAEIGIKICVESERERGYGTRLLKMFITYLFDEAGCVRIILDTNLKNLRAQHVYEKLGFRRTGIRVDSWKNQLGEPQTSIDYEMTRDDFVKFKNLH